MKRSTPASVNIDDQPGYYIRRLHQISVGLFLQELAELGLTPVQYAALQTVANQPGIDQRTLARTVALDASTTGGVVDRLEQRGAMERRTSPTDRRARQLWLTAAGEQLLSDAIPSMLQAQQQLLAPLTERQRAEFMRLMRIVIDENNIHSRAPSETTR
ncbi:MAG: MarR family transcriptional regulator [Hydrogenophaga sp.]|uniref:MarR family winged helix-turn-helix transcriptional regulator n=1 Tax=Hydrogenophaga sp. TaxID=1904254 RepID=UPI001D36B0C5|nr:MarR family transcriptional regulator [Hydrogenophaga sp.]MBX3608392.1 MarR family transcriptional regulator [Hydrogenophaga sp.]